MQSNYQSHARLGYAPGDLRDAVGISRTKTYELIRDGRLRARKLDRRTVILSADLERFLNGLPVLEASDE